ncbi:5,10-methylenetetrahydromethanopterin reductase [Natronoarchaeum philippinense]|uniref:5,10-methylenetetrahydromethanopterin reductase n=1 Tax=Natronoarchaeum philippinense TaxID=558529 RepID=A0A285NU13_NATPI|nr:5,10-methylenetetrahydromethanopterin reductase [Natronoarchaeum philippinense]SNZ12413.1 5,10-methylenetetrahydromethanopterin reductase [Natronoarchaeum philippinense]
MHGIELTPEHPVAETVEHAESAESEGFDAIFAASHYFNRDPFIALDRIAAATEEVQIGPAAANPYDTHPVTLASRMATLQEVSDERGVFGVGPGDKSTLSSLGVERDRPLRRVLESFKVAQDLWAGERVSIDGTFTASDAGLEYDVEGEIPVYVGAQGPHMIRMSAKHADGVLINASHPDDFAWAADRVAEGKDERPDERGEFDVAAYASVSVAEDADAAREVARQPVAFIAAGAAPPVLDRHGLDADAAETIGDAIERGDFGEAFDAVTPAMIDAFSVAGTPEDVADRIEKILQYTDSFVAGTPLGPDQEEAIALLSAALDRATRE